MAEKIAIIADAGPLIALSRIDALPLLRAVFETVAITPEVRDELLPEGSYPGKSDLEAALKAGWLVCQDFPADPWQPINPGVDQGEASCIRAAISLPDCLLLMDDRAGRAEAKARGMAVIGTAALIGMAKLRGLIPSARPLLERLPQVGYFISREVIEAVLLDVGE